MNIFDENNQVREEFEDVSSMESEYKVITREQTIELAFPAMCKIIIDEVETKFLLNLSYLIKIEPFTLASTKELLFLAHAVRIVEVREHGKIIQREQTMPRNTIILLKGQLKTVVNVYLPLDSEAHNGRKRLKEMEKTFVFS